LALHQFEGRVGHIYGAEEAIVSAIERTEVLARTEKQKGVRHFSPRSGPPSADTKGFCFHAAAPHTVTSITDTKHPFAPD